MQISAELSTRGLKFVETSYIIYETDGDGIIYSIELTISFKPEELSGILMYAAQYENGSGSHLFAQVNDGRFEFSFATSLSNVITIRLEILR